MARVRITKKEKLRRERISASLKKFHKKKKREQKKLEDLIIQDFEEITNEPILRETTKRDSTKSSRRDRTTSDTPRKKTRGSKTKKGATTKQSQFVPKRKRVKVKTFPKKNNKKNFFFSDKKSFDLKRKIRVLDENGVVRVIKAVNNLRPSLTSFFTESKGKKRNKLMNIGYKIRLEFRSKDGKNKTVIDTTSFTPSFKISKKSNIDGSIDGLIENVATRFNEYLARQGFFDLKFAGVEAEMQV